MRKRNWSRGLVVVAGCAGLSAGGCFSSRPPRMEVTGARLGEASGGHSVLLIDVVATNYNEKGLPLKGIAYSVDVSGERVYSGQRDAQASVRGFGVQRITLPVPMPAAAAAPGAAFAVKGEVTYIAPEVLAQTLYDNNFRRWTTGFEGGGVVSAPAGAK